MIRLSKTLRQQKDNFKLYEKDLIENTATMQMKAYFLIGLLLSFCAIADFSVLYQKNIPVSTGFRIKIGAIIYFFLVPFLLFLIKKYQKKYLIYLAYFNIAFGLAVVLIGPIYDDFSLSLSELFALILVPSFTVFGPNIVYQGIILIIVLIDIRLEILYTQGPNALLHLLYYSFDSMCLYFMPAFVNLAIVNRKIKELEIRYELKKVSETDALTGLLNRSAAIKEIEKYSKIDSLYGMVVIDLDDFKSINDSYGHFKGDEMIKHMGHSLKASFEDIGVIARFGGDEFMVFLPNIEEKILLERLQRLQENFKTLNEDFKEYTFSYGYTILKNDKRRELFRVLFGKADENMYKQKEGKKK